MKKDKTILLQLNGDTSIVDAFLGTNITNIYSKVGNLSTNIFRAEEKLWDDIKYWCDVKYIPTDNEFAFKTKREKQKAKVLCFAFLKKKFKYLLDYTEEDLNKDYFKDVKKQRDNYLEAIEIALDNLTTNKD